MQSFTQRLAVQLTIWQATTFLIGEYLKDTIENNPVQTVADGIFVLSQSTERNSVVRKLHVVKSRGQATMSGLHTLRISHDGLQVYPRMSISTPESERARPSGRATTGIAGLDALVGGGIPIGDAMLVSGPSGSGKSVLATQFIAAGVQAGEPGVIAVFEEHPKEYLRRAQQLGIDLETMERQDTVAIIYVRPLDLSPDETLTAIREAAERIRAKRVVIDSISGFELALAPTFREDFRESLYRLVGALTGKGITVLVTMEIVQSYTDLRFSPYVISFLADDIILLRYVELAGQLRKSLVVVKMRNSGHSKEMRLYEITDRGLIVRESLQDYQGIGTGTTELRAGVQPPMHPGLIKEELSVLHALIELGEAPVAALAQRSGLAEGGGLIAALDRLVRLDYAVKLENDGDTRYRPVAREMR
ncbi:MAG: AAA family ATPase [Chloroflexales bacterium]|nr:AAA family ATPase [Chloroflexales bacterium]